jgi:16S rRNA (cytosine967-C5)-methyltransferase
VTPRSPESARDVARAVLRRVEQGEAYATLALGGALARSRLGPADRGFATELVYGVLRQRARLDRALAAQAPGKLKLSAPGMIALRLAAYQLLVLGTPAHAAVDDAVGAVRATLGPRVAGFANAVLRKLAAAGEPAPPADLLGRLEAVYSLPPWLARRLLAAVGPAEVEDAARALLEAPPVSLRVPLWRVTRAAALEALATARPGAEFAAVRWLPEGLDARGAGAPEELAAFQGGLVTPQDAAAQLVGRLCGARPGERILDACAGVGGKSTHLAEQALAAGGAAHLDAADLSRRKLDLAEDSARRLGLTGIRAVVADLTRADAPLAHAYDRVLLDAPCSGLGVVRRHPESKWRRRDDEIAELAALQARLLDALAPRVRPGGVLVYSVCTFTEEEGAAQVARFLAAHPDFARAAPAPVEGVEWAAFLGADGAFRSWPHRHGTDAFFAARLERRATP